MNCPIDGTPLEVWQQADENGVFTYYECMAKPSHTYRSAWSGIEWVPDFSEVEERDDPPI